MSQNKQRATKAGRRAEFWAAWLLRLKAYRILARNYRNRMGEIDIIARRGTLLVLVEVKYRPDMEQAKQAVSVRQWQRIERAATDFVASHKVLHGCRWRFDVVACAPRKWPKHIEDAWRTR